MNGGEDFAAGTLRAMQRLAQEVAGKRPELLNTDASVGELAWVWGKDRAELGERWRTRIWWEEDEPAAWGWVTLPHTVPTGDGNRREFAQARLCWQVHPHRPELLDEVLDWFDGLAPGADHRLDVRAADAESAGRLEGHGYEYLADDESWVVMNARDLHDVDEPVVPDGYRFRTAADAGPDAVVAAHAGAWHPSTFTRRGYEGVRETWPYREDLHVLLQAPDGTPVSSAIIWLDEENAGAEFEPVGTHRDHRRKGFGRALLLHGMRRAREAGAHHMRVGSLGAPAHDAARELYRSVGFQELTRDLPHLKRAKPAAD